MSKRNIVYEKSYKFAVRVINLNKYLTSEKNEYVLSKQILRSGTAIGALISEAKYAQSGLDFLNKMNIALKEANESLYWLSLLKETEYINDAMYSSMHKDADEIVSLLVIIVKKCRAKLGDKNKYFISI